MLKNKHKNLYKEKVNTKLKTGDEVIVISGKHKGSKSRIVKIDFVENKALLEAVNMVKKTQKRKNEQDKGGIIEKEAYIHLSNIMILDKNGNKTRIKYKLENGEKIRVSSKGEMI